MAICRARYSRRADPGQDQLSQHQPSSPRHNTAAASACKYDFFLPSAAPKSTAQFGASSLQQ
jgi:hypothetical protein